MPDRVTNSIALADGGVSCRPTVINMYDVAMPDAESWWTQFAPPACAISRGVNVRPVSGFKEVGPEKRALGRLSRGGGLSKAAASSS